MRQKIDAKLLASILTYGIPLIAIIGITAPIILGKYNFAILGSYLAIPMVVSFIAYRSFINTFPVKYKEIEHPGFILTATVYNVFFIISLILLYINTIRPVSYYLVISIMAGIIIFEITNFNIVRSKAIIIMLQMMVLLSNIIWSTTLKYYFYISRTDPIAHVWCIKNILIYGHITDAFETYKPFPLWHILCSCIIYLFEWDWPLQKHMYLTNGIIYAIAILAIYSVSYRILQDYKLALISSLFFCFYPEIISYGMSSIPRSIASILEIMFLLIIISEKNERRVMLSILLGLAIIIYHPASMPFILVILVLISVFQYVFKETKARKVSLIIIALLLITTLAYWMFYADEIFSSIISNIGEPAMPGIKTKSIMTTPINEIFNYLQYSPLVFFSLVGGLYALNNRMKTINSRIYILIGLLLMVFAFPGPALLLNKLATSFNVLRFGEYAFPFICIGSAIGFNIIYARSGRYIRCLTIITFIIFSLLAISNDFNASDNPLVKRPFYTFYLNEEEVNSFNRIANITDGFVMSDYTTTRFLQSTPYESKAHQLEISKESMAFLRNSSKDTILIRLDELKGRPLKMYTCASGDFKMTIGVDTNLEYYYNDLPVWHELNTYNKIYSSGGVIAVN